MPKWSAIGLTAVRGMASAETQAGRPAKVVVPAETQTTVPAETQAAVPATVVVVPAPAAVTAAAEARVGGLSLGPALLFCLVLSCLSAGCQHPGPPRVR